MRSKNNVKLDPRDEARLAKLEKHDHRVEHVFRRILHTLERMPTVGECVRWGEFTFEVVDMDGPRIDKVIVKKVPQIPLEE